jgi:tetratricopeptide (TPR) repeat protein
MRRPPTPVGGALILGLLLFSLMPSVRAAALPHQPPLFAEAAAFREAESLIFSEAGSTARIEELIRSAREQIRTEGDPGYREYWLARTHLLLATHYNHVDDGRAAEREIRAGFAAIEAAIRRDGEFSEGARVRSDLHSQMMFARGMVYMARNGAEARDLAFRARELDPDNVKAAITVAGYYLNAPRFAGGDPGEGRRILEEALASHPENLNDRFLIFGLLAEVAGDLGDTSRAREFLQGAADIYPDSPWIAQLREEIG